jgi:iron complex outermembrane receptor protein
VKAGGFNSAAPTPAELPFDPEENWTYEIGAKTDWFNRRLRLNASLFQVKMDGIQITNPSPNAPATFITANAGTGTSEGFELEIAAKATEKLRVTFAYSLADAKFDRARDGSLRSYPSFAASQDVSGQQLPRQAKHLVNLAFDYEAPAFAGYRWYGHLDGRYESKRNGFTHERLGFIGSRTIANAKIGLAKDNVDFSLWVRNLTNDDTPLLANTTLTLNDFLRQPVSVLPDLRSFGLTAIYRF